MDGIHDMGGMHGFGKIVREEDELLFHAEWEKRAFGVCLQAAEGAEFVDDHLRANIERIPTHIYLRSTYYELLDPLGLRDPRAARHPDQCPDRERMAALTGPGRAEGGSDITLDEIDEMMAAGASTKRPEVEVAARFKPGDRVRVRNDHSAHHTRSPRYCRGRYGEVIADHGVFVYPDSNSQDQGENPEHCYTVRFAAEDLWGESAKVGDSVHVDLWDSYLEPA